MVHYGSMFIGNKVSAVYICDATIYLRLKC